MTKGQFFTIMTKWQIKQNDNDKFLIKLETIPL